MDHLDVDIMELFDEYTTIKYNGVLKESEVEKTEADLVNFFLKEQKNYEILKNYTMEFFINENGRLIVRIK